MQTTRQSPMRLLCLFLTAALILCLSGCDPAASGSRGEDGQAEFDAYLEALLPEMVDMSTYDAGYLFLDPEVVGLETAGSSFGYTTPAEWSEMMTETEEELESLARFDPSQLDETSQYTLQLLKDSLERSLSMEDYYMFAANGLGIESGAATLGTTIAHAPYRSTADFDRLFALYADLPEVFAKLSKLEEERQSAGMGMTADEISLALEEYEKLIAGDPPAAQQLGDELIDSADFLNEAEKQSYHEKNAKAVADYLIPAYKQLIQDLEQIGGREGLPGLAGRTHGSEYYRALLKSVGFDETPEQLMTYLEEKFDQYAAEITRFVQQLDDMEALSDYIEDPEGFSYTDLETAEEIVDYLKEVMRADYPDVDAGEVDVVLTPEALRSPGVVAYYVIQPLDQSAAAAKDIFINDESTGADYMTLAHESFPGHLYTDAYTLSQNRNPVRRLAERGYLASQEGWGVYSEMMAAGYAQTDELVAKIAALSYLSDRVIWAWCDIGLNYLGWTPAELNEQLEEQFGFSIPDIEGEFTQLLAAMPGTWVLYGAGGAKFMDMRYNAAKTLGEDFDAAAFHAVLLDAMPASFTMIQKQVDVFVESVQTVSLAEAA